MDESYKKFNPESARQIRGHIIQWRDNYKHEVDGKTGDLVITDPGLVRFLLDIGLRAGETVTIQKSSGNNVGEITEIDPLRKILKVKLFD